MLVLMMKPHSAVDIQNIRFAGPTHSGKRNYSAAPNIRIIHVIVIIHVITTHDYYTHVITIAHVNTIV